MHRIASPRGGKSLTKSYTLLNDIVYVGPLRNIVTLALAAAVLVVGKL